MRMRLTGATAAAMMLLGSAAQAQSKPARPLPVLRGTIQDTAGKPLDGALIEIVGAQKRMFTSASGSYRLDEIKPGKYWVVARRIGYTPLQTAMTLGLGEDREVIFQLEPLAHVLPEELVRGDDREWQKRYGDFAARSRGAFGYFLTRDDIQRARPLYLGDVVRRYLPFIRSDLYFTPAFADFSRSMSGVQGFDVSSRYRSNQACAPLVSLNGGMPNGIFAVNDFRPEMVEALEVYKGTRMVPAEFSGYDTRCGLVVIWTRR
jgi:hypothetical protein